MLKRLNSKGDAHWRELGQSDFDSDISFKTYKYHDVAILIYYCGKLNREKVNIQENKKKIYTFQNKQVD